MIRSSRLVLGVDSSCGMKMNRQRKLYHADPSSLLLLRRVRYNSCNNTRYNNMTNIRQRQSIRCVMMMVMIFISLIVWEKYSYHDGLTMQSVSSFQTNINNGGRVQQYRQRHPQQQPSQQQKQLLVGREMCSTWNDKNILAPPSSNSYHHSYTKATKRFSSTKSDDDNDSTNSNSSNDETFLNWLSSSSSSNQQQQSTSSSKQMVQPIGMDGQPIQPLMQSTTNRIRPNFANLFQGMPGLNDIIGGGSTSDTSTSNSDGNNSSGNDSNATDDEDDEDDDELDDNYPSRTNDKNPMGRPKRRRFREDKDAVDETWFEKERQQIISKYDSIMKDMTEQIMNERKVDPESVPNNAEELMKSILKQEMENELQTTKNDRIQEQYLSYQDTKQLQMDEENNRDGSSTNVVIPNPNIQRLMDESEAQYVQQSKSQNELQSFLQYQQSRLQQQQESTKDPANKPSVQLPKPNENLDVWALERLKEMANARDGQEDVDEMILDILQDNVNQLENGIRKKADQRWAASQQQEQPQTMKEWQMYRSIASRIGKGNKNSNNDDDQNDDIQRDEKIMEQLRLWKEYIQKEEVTREQSGLSRGPKLPFPWQESIDPQRTALTNSDSNNHDKASRIEIRKKLNRMSIEAMESLLANSDDPVRRNKLQKEIDYLKSTLVGNDYLDIDESMFDTESTTSSSSSAINGPLNTTDLFTSKLDDKDTYYGWDTSSSSTTTSVGTTPFASLDSTTNNNIDDFVDRPGTSSRPPPPKTAFFADIDDDKEYDLGETLTGDSKLGNMEEQKLEAMFRRAGVKTAEERRFIRSQYEEFKELERSKRLESGLSGSIDSSSGSDGTGNEIKYNVADVIKEDGDIDAEAILATIGPRPVRKKKDNVVPSIDNTGSNPKSISSVKPEEVIDSLFRSVSAVGGGRYKDDPETKQQERSSFEEFVLKESRMRESLDDPSIPSRTTLNDLQLPDPVDDETYAKEVLSSLGPRPKAKRSKVINPREYSDRGGVLASNDDMDEDDEDDEEEEEDVIQDKDYVSTISDSNSDADFDLVPEWLRKENEDAMTKSVGSKTLFGSEIDEVFDNDQYEHNMRQLAEYEKRRSGQSRSMGIDISDVLGRRDSDDYADFKYDDDSFRSRRSDDWGYGSFASRKANLLEYIELDVREINALMNHKDSVYSTGVSQYLPRINKPFKEFGAIFRLEGIILDVNGLQLETWIKVAEEYGFKKPTIDDVRLAAVTRPETAVKDVFAWSDDFLECRSIAASHRRTFKSVFTSWASSNGINVSEVPVMKSDYNSFTFGSEKRQDPRNKVEPRSQMNESDRLRKTTSAWLATAAEFNKPPPDDTAILIASSLNEDIAILKVFKWSSDPLEVDRIARSYRLNLQADKGAQAKSNDDPISTSNHKESKTPQSRTEMMELHYKAWCDVAKSFGYNPPATDEVLAAFVINEPEIAARGFGWSDDGEKLSRIAQEFRLKLLQLQNKTTGTIAESKTSTASGQSIKQDKSREAASRDDLFKIAFDAWSETARINGYQTPDADQVQFALSVGPEEAIVTGFEWSTNPAEISKILRCYRDTIGRIRGIEYKAAASDEKTKSDKSISGPSPDDVYRTVFDSWTAIAKELGYPLPDDEQVQFALAVGAEEAIVNGFGWSNESSKIAEIMTRYKAEIAKRRSVWQKTSMTNAASTKKHDEIPMYKVTPGVNRWIKSLLDVDMQCAIVSYLERDQVDTLLELAGVSDLFAAANRVSASNGYVTDTDMLLGAALRIERRPDHCVVFDTTPYSSVAAHEVEMQSVCLIGPYPRYELLSADTTAASFDSLTAINIRRLFSERIYDQPQLDVQTTDPGKTRNTKTRTRFFDDD